MMRNSFARTHEMMFYNTPSFEAYLDAQSGDVHYDYFKLQLQILQNQSKRLKAHKSRPTPPPVSPGGLQLSVSDSLSDETTAMLPPPPPTADPPRKWVFKCPFHLSSLDSLLHAFPDANIVWTHRDVAKVVPSCISLASHLSVMVSDHVDAHELGTQWCNRLSKWVTQAMAVRDRIRQTTQPASQSSATSPARAESDIFYDLQYNSIVRDPISAVRGVYRHFNRELTPEAEQRMREYLTSNAEQKGSHKYSLDMYGLNEAQVNSMFARYTSTYLSIPV